MAGGGEPAVAVSTLPTSAIPEIVGGSAPALGAATRRSTTAASKARAIGTSARVPVVRCAVGHRPAVRQLPSLRLAVWAQAHARGVDPLFARGAGRIRDAPADIAVGQRATAPPEPPTRPGRHGRWDGLGRHS